jgi:hypothetical protein
VFPLVWKGVKPWLDVRTTNKIQISARPEQWQPMLLAAIDADQLPREYGGTGEPLKERDHSKDTIESIALTLPPSMSMGLDKSGSMALDRSGSVRRVGSERRAHLSADLRGAAGAGADNNSDDGSETFQDAIMLDIELYEGDTAARLGLTLEQLGASIRELGPNWRSHLLAMEEPIPAVFESVTKDVSLGGSPAMTLGATQGAMWSDQLSNVLDAAPMLCSLCRWVLSWDVDRLRQSIERANVVCILFGIMIIIFGVYVLSSMYWISELVEVMMWLSVVIVCLGCCILLLSFIGYLGYVGQSSAWCRCE